MFNFPYLKSLVEKNRHCQGLFTRTAQWEKSQALRSSRRGEKEKKSNLQADIKDADKKDDAAALVHWKKAIKIKFEEETHEDVEKNSWMEWLKNWNFESILRPTSADVAAHNCKDAEIECKICDEVFETRRQLSQHKRLEHFPSWEGGSKHFCYVPYFVEPKRFNLLRGTLAKEQYECIACQRWLGGGVAQRVGPYLERLRLKTKEGSAAINRDQIDDFNKDGGKKRDRKCKSMTRRVCELCSKILSNRKGLERHMLIHTGEKPFPCDICGKPFRRKDNCVRHKKTAHLFKKPRKPRCRKSKISSIKTKNKRVGMPLSDSVASRDF